MHTNSKRLVAWVLVLLTGCYGTSDVLERDGGAQDVPLSDVPGLLDAPVNFLDAPGSDAPRFLADAPLGDGAEVWEGYVEGFTFWSGSDHLRLALDSASGDGPRTGTVTFGAGTPPAPARDPLVGYPIIDGVFTDSTRDIYEGFAYRVETGTRTGERTQLTISSSSLWADWCQLQTPYTEMDQWGCLPPTRSYGGGGGRCGYGTLEDPEAFIPVDCGQLWLCRGEGRWVCSCSATGCVHSAMPTHTLDFRTTADSATGTLVLSGVSRVVHLTRVR